MLIYNFYIDNKLTVHCSLFTVHLSEQYLPVISHKSPEIRIQRLEARGQNVRKPKSDGSLLTVYCSLLSEQYFPVTSHQLPVTKKSPLARACPAFDGDLGVDLQVTNHQSLNTNHNEFR